MLFQFGAPPVEADVADRYKSKEGKMEKSFLNFTAVRLPVFPSFQKKTN